MGVMTGDIGNSDAVVGGGWFWCLNEKFRHDKIDKRC